ncbi:DNA replication complex GINS protein SLD5 [Harmonia axyridis]|uniref:DNA replication complex GINS protein SLD5 n=1 Tax=Harmonia axyridis TaxID=115357 RepID=UPI001E2773BD|nr:DNA replication complex GINS protein SLD5 [Harmonia axyridis]
MEVEQYIDNLLDSQDAENEIVLSPAALIQIIEEAWLNEKFSPEILPNKIEYIELLLGQLTAMEENLNNTSDKDLKKSIHQLEVERLKYLVCSYLRIRLEKIEMFVEYVLKQENERTVMGEDCYLTESELNFAKNYKEGLDKHFDNIMKVHSTIPTEWKNHIIQPNLHSFVFLKSKANIESIVIDEGNEDETVYVNNDSQMIISYNSISNLVKNGEVQLI